MGGAEQPKGDVYRCADLLSPRSSLAKLLIKECYLDGDFPLRQLLRNFFTTLNKREGFESLFNVSEAKLPIFGDTVSYDSLKSKADIHISAIDVLILRQMLDSIYRTGGEITDNDNAVLDIVLRMWVELKAIFHKKYSLQIFSDFITALAAPDKLKNKNNATKLFAKLLLFCVALHQQNSDGDFSIDWLDKPEFIEFISEMHVCDFLTFDDETNSLSVEPNIIKMYQEFRCRYLPVCFVIPDIAFPPQPSTDAVAKYHLQEGIDLRIDRLQDMDFFLQETLQSRLNPREWQYIENNILLFRQTRERRTLHLCRREAMLLDACISTAIPHLICNGAIRSEVLSGELSCHDISRADVDHQKLLHRGVKSWVKYLKLLIHFPHQKALLTFTKKFLEHYSLDYKYFDMIYLKLFMLLQVRGDINLEKLTAASQQRLIGACDFVLREEWSYFEYRSKSVVLSREVVTLFENLDMSVPDNVAVEALVSLRSAAQDTADASAQQAPAGPAQDLMRSKL